MASRWQRQRFAPGPRLVWVLCALAPLWLLSGAWLVLADLLVLALAFYESRALHARLPHVTRELPARLTLGESQPIALHVHNPSAYRVRVRISDDAPEALHCSPELQLELAPFERRTLHYQVTAKRRGPQHFGALHLRLDGALGLGAQIALQPSGADVCVYPSPRGPVRYEVALRRAALSGIGIRRAGRQAGAGELDQLREYVPGDALRDLAWKASAKRLHPITRVHGQEQSQTILIAIDAGRLMAATLADLSKLDHAIHAALLVAWVALRAGDAVGVVVLGQEVLGSVLPARGRAQYRRILECVHAIEPSAPYVDFRALARFVHRSVPRRALLLVFSDLFDESQALPLSAELPKLRPKHVPLCVTLRDPITTQLAQATAADDAAVYLRAAAADLVAERALIKRQLTRAGVQVLEASARELGTATVNRYLEIKRQHML